MEALGTDTPKWTDWEKRLRAAFLKKVPSEIIGGTAIQTWLDNEMELLRSTNQNSATAVGRSLRAHQALNMQDAAAEDEDDDEVYELSDIEGDTLPSDHYLIMDRWEEMVNAARTLDEVRAIRDRFVRVYPDTGPDRPDYEEGQAFLKFFAPKQHELRTTTQDELKTTGAPAGKSVAGKSAVPIAYIQSKGDSDMHDILYAISRAQTRAELNQLRNKVATEGWSGSNQKELYLAIDKQQAHLLGVDTKPDPEVSVDATANGSKERRYISESQIKDYLPIIQQLKNNEIDIWEAYELTRELISSADTFDPAALKWLVEGLSSITNTSVSDVEKAIGTESGLVKAEQTLLDDTTLKGLTTARNHLIDYYSKSLGIDRAEDSYEVNRIRDDAGIAADHWLETNASERWEPSHYNPDNQVTTPRPSVSDERQKFLSDLSNTQAWELWKKTIPLSQRAHLDTPPQPGTSSLFNRFQQLYNITGVGLANIGTEAEENVSGTSFLDWIKERGMKDLPTAKELRGGLSQLQKDIIEFDKITSDQPQMATGLLAHYAGKEITDPIAAIKNIFEINLAPILAETAPGFRRSMRSTYTPFLDQYLGGLASQGSGDPMDFLRQVMEQTEGQGFGKAFRPNNIPVEVPPTGGPSIDTEAEAVPDGESFVSWIKKRLLLR